MSAIDELEAWIPERDRFCESVSGWTVGMQVHHALQVIESVAVMVAESEPGAKKPGFSFWRTVTMVTGRIPRGRAKAPKGVRPPEQPSLDELERMARVARESLQRLVDADPESYFNHHIFGVVQRDPAIRFVDIHSRHHLRIIKEIVAGSKAAEA